MPDLNYQVEGAEPRRHAASPTLDFKLRVSEVIAPGAVPTPIHSLILRCQIRIEPARRTYTPSEKERLRDLFGSTDRWGQTLRPMLWTHVSANLSAFEGSDLADLPVPCSYDFNLAATKYFAAMEGGDLPLCFLFSGTIFSEGDGGGLRVSQISREKEAEYRLPAAAWQGLMDHYYPNTAWLGLRKDVFDRLEAFRSRLGLTTSDQALERLLASAGEPVTP
jgi:hypothetical protein